MNDTLESAIRAALADDASHAPTGPAEWTGPTYALVEETQRRSPWRYPPSPQPPPSPSSASPSFKKTRLHV
jgi:hypothetical protein